MKQLFQNFSWETFLGLAPSQLLSVLVLALLALCIIGPLVVWICIGTKETVVRLGKDKQLWLFLAGATAIGFVIEAFK